MSVRLPTAIILASVFTNQFITDAFNLLIDNLLPLSEADWENWNDGPEEWLVDSLDASQAWSYDFRVRWSQEGLWSLYLIA